MILNRLRKILFEKDTLNAFMILMGGFIAGATIQFNWAKGCLLQMGIGPCFMGNKIRILTSALLCSLVFLLLHKIVILITKHFQLAEELNMVQRSRFFFASFSFLILYFFFEPNTIVLYALVLSVVLINIFRTYLAALFNVERQGDQYYKQIILLFLLILIPNLLIEISLLFSNSVLNYYTYTRLFPASLIYLVLPILLPRIIKPYSIFIFLLFFIASIPAISHILTYGSEMPSSSYYAIWETNSVEAVDYVKQNINIGILSVLLPLMLVMLFITIRILRFKHQKVKLLIRLLVGFCMCLIPLLAGLSQYNIPNKFATNYLKYKLEIQLFIGEIEKRSNQNLVEKITNFQPDSAITVVVVIGESASKYHQGLYGYTRETNPLLNEIRDELFVFQDVIAPHSHTNPVLSKVLTFANHENMDLMYSTPTIIEYMKSAGFKTFWLSNQEFSDRYTTISSAIALQSNKFYFTFDKENPSICFDGRLLKPFQVALNDNALKKFIIIHLMGSHSDKTIRYPKEFNHFKTDEGITSQPYHRPWPISVINAHDNSVLYNDWLLRTFIEGLRNEHPNALFLYFPDHGEELFEYRDFWGHAEANASIYMFDIPFLLWLSDKYKVENPELTTNLSTYLNRKYQTDDVIHSIIDLTKCTSPLFDPQRSIFNAAFKERKRIIKNQDYDAMIKTKKSVDDTP
ncbi:MAG: sulfatase-like hydrolase/transferase [Salinivirgaceae bacterium]|nr:sulfatase-like hydrolase/transferase [Salinivirgaceae bacterium]